MRRDLIRSLVLLLLFGEISSFQQFRTISVAKASLSNVGKKLSSARTSSRRLPPQCNRIRPSISRSTILWSSYFDDGIHSPDMEVTQSVSGIAPPTTTSAEEGVTAENNSEIINGDTYEMEREKEQRKRKERIAQLLAEEDRKFKEERRLKKWGKFANATSREEIAALEKEEQKAIEKENEQKTLSAQKSGVTMELLEPANDDYAYDDEKGKVKMVLGSKLGGGKSFLTDLDDELAEEWKAMQGGDENAVIEEYDEGSQSAGRRGGAESTVLDKSTGKLVNRHRLKGIRVGGLFNSESATIGSAAGWSLEVFPGDFVVHRKYGIGRFERSCLIPKTKLTKEEIRAQLTRRDDLTREFIRGIGKSIKPDQVKEFQAKFGTEEDKDPVSNPQSTVLEIQYADSLVHVPIDRAYRLSRYRAGDTIIKPKLSKVRGDAWRKAKRKVEENTLQLAQDVLALYATRETLQRPPFDPSIEPQIQKFYETFPFEPTPDQKKCFEEVEADMVWRSRPMDRLVCGDVGFGKTEVALRALVRTIANGKQAAFLAPTGVLASQHFKNCLKRMGPGTDFPYEVRLLRGGMGRRTKGGRELRDEIESGKVQLIVGTHALLSNDLKFHDLGLLVVDEEQRFGVKQKERLKLISKGIDVLTMTATPIPRTLQMSLSGIRDTSTIRSPPPMRKPTITIVQDYNEDLVKLAIERELERQGQTYYVVPRISMMKDARATLLELFPGIEIIEAHGRMGRGVAEENVSKFAEGKGQVLLATTVIENGVDIPTVNTILIDNSQSFGMSTLYQLRGRVGRSDKQAYAYFMHREDSISEQAMMRLQAMGELTELGSGFDLANRDLEIRGAGSLLGTEQSGMASKVGFDLYMRMLRKSIRLLRGLDLPVLPRTNMLLPEASIEVEGPDGVSHSFRIPESFIPDPTKRAKEEASARLAESTAKLVELTNSWKKEYGTLPVGLQMSLKRMHLHACTRRLGIDLVGLLERGDGQLDCILRSPGLRPRHLSLICPKLSNARLTKGLKIIFPDRFRMNGLDNEIPGGSKLEWDRLSVEGSNSASSISDESDEWDALDQEEAEALKEISSAFRVKDLDEVDLEQYPRFVVENLGSVPPEQRVDVLLKVLLPSSKVVFERQNEDAEKAKVASELRDKQQEMKLKKRRQSRDEQRRNYLSYS